MHFKIHDKKELAKKVTLNVKTIDRNSLVSSLSNIKLEIADSTLILTSFDGNNCVVSKMDVENIDGVNQSLLIDSTSFKSIVDRLSLVNADTIEFELLDDSSELSIKAKRTKLKIKTVLDSSDFDLVPSVKEFESFKTVSFDKSELVRAVSNVAKCSSRDNTKPELEAINFIISGNSCDVVSLDGYKLALNILECEGSEDFKISVSATKLKSILKDVSANENDKVELKTNGKYTLIQSGDINIFIREIDGRLAPYKKLLNKNFNYELTINTGEMSSVVNSSMMATSKDNKVVKLKINPEDSTIEFNSKGDIISDFVDEIDVMFNSSEEEALEIAFNSTYLTELVGNVDCQNLKMYIKDSLSPVFIESEDNENDTYLLLPVRLNVR